MTSALCRSNPDPTACANKPRIIRKDLDDNDESYFLKLVYEACQCYNDPVDLCSSIKQCLDKKFGRMWHVVVGPEFGRLVTTKQQKLILNNNSLRSVMLMKKKLSSNSLKGLETARHILLA